MVLKAESTAIRRALSTGPERLFEDQKLVGSADRPLCVYIVVLIELIVPAPKRQPRLPGMPFGSPAAAADESMPLASLPPRPRSGTFFGNITY